MSSRSARETAYQTIRSRIITMELKPGDPLNDRELAEELGISRTPMREALLMLSLARMVDIKPQSGTHVAPINLKLMEMEQFSRYTLEKEILNRLRGRLTEEQIADALQAAACGAHPQIQPADRGKQVGMRGAYPHSGSADQRQPGGCGRSAAKPPDPLQAFGGAGKGGPSGIFHRRIRKRGMPEKRAFPFCV